MEKSKVSRKLEAPFYFGDVRFRWDPNKKAYVSYGDLGIANIIKDGHEIR